MSGTLGAEGKASLPEALPEELPGHGAPRLCDRSGTCHFVVRSQQAEAVLEGLASDAMERFCKAFGGKQAFLNALQKSGPHSDLAPVLHDQLEAYRKK